MRLLVIDDDEIIRDVIVHQLTRAGHTAVAVGDGAQALASLAGARFDAIVCDWEMPVMDGPAFVGALRNRPGGFDHYVIMLTGRDVPSAEFDGFAAGVDAFLTKPHTATDLLAAVRTAELIQGRMTKAA